jgi:hypothetical protein
MAFAAAAAAAAASPDDADRATVAFPHAVSAHVHVNPTAASAQTLYRLPREPDGIGTLSPALGSPPARAGARPYVIAYAVAVGRGRWLALAAGAVAALAGPASASASSDAASTRAYLEANLSGARIAAAHIGPARAAINGVLAHVRQSCPLAAAESPQDPESTQLSNEVIGAMVTTALHVDLPALRHFVRATQALRWSSAAVTRQVHQYVSQVSTMGSLPEPDVCADVRAWAVSGYKTLPASTLSFSPRFMASWVALAEIPEALGRFIGASLRPLVQQAAGFASELSEFEVHEVENWGRIMDALGLHP